jgi:hypothetical protein
MKDEQGREQNGVGDRGEAVRMSTQRGLAPPGPRAARTVDDDIYERDSDGAALARPRQPDPDAELPADRAEYVSPRTLPPTEAHKTFEMQTVKVKDEVRFPQKGIPTERNLPRLADASGALPFAAAASTPAPSPAHETPPGPPTAADAVGSFATEAGMYKSPLATADIPPATDDNGVPINLLASASPWGASAQSAAFDPEPGVLVSGSYTRTREPPRVYKPGHAIERWSTRTKVLLCSIAIGAPLAMLLMFAFRPSRNGTEAAAAATQSMGPIPTPHATAVAPAAPTEAAAMPAGTTAPAPLPAAAAPATPASVKSSAPTAPTTNPELSPKPAATSNAAASKPGEGPAPAKPPAAATSTPASPTTTPATPPIPRPF